MAEDKMLQEAIEAARLGQRGRARDLLARLLRTNQKNPDYWLYMSAVVDSPKERIFCLESTLKLDPENQAAQRGLVILGARPPDENISPVKPDRQRQWDLGEIGASPDDPAKEDKARPALAPARLGGIAGVGLIALALLMVGIFGNPFAAAPTAAPKRGTLQPLGVGGPTVTFLPTGSLHASNLTATLLGPTPLAQLLDAPHTATPHYVNTPHPNAEAYRSAMRAYDRGDWEAAVNFFEQVIELDAAAVDARYHLGKAYYNLAEYFKAKTAFNSAITINPNFAPPYLGRALADLKLNPNKIVFKDLDKAIALDPNFGEAFIARGIYRFDRNNPDGALEDLEQAENIYPLSHEVHFHKAKVLFSLKRYPEAIESAQLANELDITNLETYWVLAQALHANGQTPETIGPLQTYLLYEEEFAEGWLILGQAYQMTGYPENAIQALDKALEFDYRLFEANYYRGEAYIDLEDYDKAISNLKNAVRIFPDWFEAHLALGRAIFLSGDEGNGYLTIQRQAAHLAKTDKQLVLLYYWRATALDAIGQEEDALADWAALLEMPSDLVPDEWARTARNRLRAGGYPTETRTPYAGTPTPYASLTPSP
ncbi:MAG: tetratricopeptide repeat protein [Anaerolineae bacterium]|nr:tetratricopeptide repeat protein [Anaerolineae bacterium]